MNIFSKRFKALRVREDLQQIEIAGIFNIDRTTVAKWESGDNMPTVKTLIEISEYFNVSTDYLLGLDGQDIRVVEISENRRRFNAALDKIRVDTLAENEADFLINNLHNLAQNIKNIREQPVQSSSRALSENQPVVSEKRQRKK